MNFSDKLNILGYTVSLLILLRFSANASGNLKFYVFFFNVAEF